MPRSSSSPTAALPTRRSPRAYAGAAGGLLAPKSRVTGRFVPAADDPLAALEAEVRGKIAGVKATKLTGHGKPLGGLPVFGERRAPARRASFRTPPR